MAGQETKTARIVTGIISAWIKNVLIQDLAYICEVKNDFNAAGPVYQTGLFAVRKDDEVKEAFHK